MSPDAGFQLDRIEASRLHQAQTLGLRRACRLLRPHPAAPVSTARPLQRWFYWSAIIWAVLTTCISFAGWKAMGFRTAGFWRSLWVAGPPSSSRPPPSYSPRNSTPSTRPARFVQWIGTFLGLRHLVVRAAVSDAGILSAAHVASYSPIRNGPPSQPHSSLRSRICPTRSSRQ